MVESTSPEPNGPREFAAADTSGWDPDLCGDIDLTIDAEVTWSYQGLPLDRPALVQLFASVLRREDDGEYYLVTPVEKVRIEVADVPFRVDECEIIRGPEPRIRFTTHVGETVPLDAAHPLSFEVRNPTLGARPYLRVRDGLDAVLSRPIYYRLAEEAVEAEDGRRGVWSAGTFFPLEESPLS